MAATRAQTLDRPDGSAGAPAVRALLGWATVAAVLIPILARVLSAPVARDEQMFFAVAMLGHAHDIYGELGFNHLPNLPLLAGPLLRMSDTPFLVARLIVFAAWIALSLLVAHAAYRETGRPAIAALAVLLLGSSPLLVNETGTLFGTNLLPMPFALGGVLLFLRALDGESAPKPGLLFLSGVLLALAAGFKANYIFAVLPVGVAALLVPRSLSPVRRLWRVVLPLLAGGLLAGAPTLVHLMTDPAGFLAHVVGYHTGPHRAHALQSDEPLVIGFGERLVLARQMWGDGGTLLIGFACLLLAVLLAKRGWRPDWRVLLVVAVMGLGALMGLVPSPSFPQYFSLPAPFLILLFLLLIREAGARELPISGPLVVALAATVLLVDGPRLLRDLPRLARPATWEPMKVHAISRQIVRATGDGQVATLSPIYVLEAGGRIYPELAAGPFVYRVADLIPAAQRHHYDRIVGADQLATLLDERAPAGILVGEHGSLDDAFVQWAEDNGMQSAPLAGGQTRYGQLALKVSVGGGP